MARLLSCVSFQALFLIFLLVNASAETEMGEEYARGRAILLLEYALKEKSAGAIASNTKVLLTELDVAPFAIATFTANWPVHYKRRSIVVIPKIYQCYAQSDRDVEAREMQNSTKLAMEVDRMSTETMKIAQTANAIVDALQNLRMELKVANLGSEALNLKKRKAWAGDQ